MSHRGLTGPHERAFDEYGAVEVDSELEDAAEGDRDDGGILEK